MQADLKITKCCNTKLFWILPTFNQQVLIFNYLFVFSIFTLFRAELPLAPSSDRSRKQANFVYFQLHELKMSAPSNHKNTLCEVVQGANYVKTNDIYHF